MRYFTSQKNILINRQTYAGSPAKSSFMLTYGTTTGTEVVTGYLRPLNEEASALNGLQYGYGFNLIVETSVDLLEGDQVVVEGVTYTIRGVVNHDRGLLTQYKRALLTKKQN